MIPLALSTSAMTTGQRVFQMNFRCVRASTLTLLLSFMLGLMLSDNAVGLIDNGIVCLHLLCRLASLVVLLYRMSCGSASCDGEHGGVMSVGGSRKIVVGERLIDFSSTDGPP